MTEAYNIDCMEYMRSLPDNAFDLAVVDPPYGNADGTAEYDRRGHIPLAGRFSKYGGDSQSVHVEREREREREREEIPWQRFGQPGSRFERYKRDEDWRDVGGEVRKKIIAWDTAPEQEYFDELFRVSRNQIIWGGNYFRLPPTRCFLVWRKLTISDSFTMAMAEYAWTSFNGNAKVFECAPQGKKDDPRFHPTQKPVELYEWIYGLYAKPGDRILDTHLGSGSSRIAAWKYNLDFVGCEIDKDYFDKQQKRFAAISSQIRMGE